MMPILVKTDNVRSGRKAKAHHGQLQPAQESKDQIQSVRILIYDGPHLLTIVMKMLHPNLNKKAN